MLKHLFRNLRRAVIEITAEEPMRWLADHGSVKIPDRNLDVIGIQGISADVVRKGLIATPLALIIGLDL